MKKELVEQGAFTVAFNVYADFETFDFGDGAIFTENTSTEVKGGHAVVLVGYDTRSSDGVDYWLLQNSWGKDWRNGDEGYFRMKRGIDLCRIESADLVTSRITIDTTAPDNDDEDPSPSTTQQTTEAPSTTVAPTTDAPTRPTTEAPTTPSPPTTPTPPSTPAPEPDQWTSYPGRFARGRAWMRSNSDGENKCFDMTFEDNRGYCQKWLREGQLWAYCGRGPKRNSPGQDCSMCQGKMLVEKVVCNGSRGGCSRVAEEAAPGVCEGRKCWCAQNLSGPPDQDARQECEADSRCKGFSIKDDKNGLKYMLLREPSGARNKSNAATFCMKTRTDNCDLYQGRQNLRALEDPTESDDLFE
jgi:hypothetical protein